MTFKQLFTAGIIVIGAVTAGWAVRGPDSIYQNIIVDKRNVVGAKGRLVSTDSKPLNNRIAWIHAHGLQYEHQDEHGISIAMSRSLFAGCTMNFPVLYEEVRAGEKLSDRVKEFHFTYNSTRGVQDIGNDLCSLIEGNSELTNTNVQIAILAHSKGGNVAQAYQLASNGRKLKRVVTLGSPHLGALAADPLMLKNAFVKLYPTIGGKLANLTESRVDFETPGMKWLCPNNQMLLDLHKMSPLDERWILYGGTVKPHKGNIWTLAELADALLLKGEDSDMLARFSPTGAALIEASGDVSGSDGLVSLNSAWAVGLTNGAQIRLLAGYNHGEVLYGKGGELELYRKILWDLVTFPSLNNPEPTFGNMDFQLPSVELFDISQTSISSFSNSRRVWIEDNEIMVSVDTLVSNVLNPGSEQLMSNSKLFSWPIWYNNNILVTRNVDGLKDLVLIEVDGRMSQLTMDGQSQMSDCDDESLIAYISDGQLLIRTPKGMTRVVIGEHLNINTPPVMWSNKIYFSHQDSTGIYNLYWVGKDVQHYSIDDAKLVAKSVCNPIKVESPWGSILLAFRIIGDDVELTAILDDRFGVGRKTFNGLIKDLGPYLRELNLSTRTQVTMDSKTGYLYIEHDGKIRQFDTLKFVTKIGPWVQQGAIDQSDIDEILPVIATGKQLDVK